MSYVLISVYDKEGISDLARELIASGYKILSARWDSKTPES